RCFSCGPGRRRGHPSPRQVVVRDVPQRHRDGRRRRAQPAVRHGSPGMGPRDGGAAGVVGDHAVHAASADRAARVRARRAVRPAPRPRRARAGPAPGALGGGAAAAHRAARLRHGVHGDGGQVPAEVRRVRVPALRAAAPVLLDLHLRLLPIPAVAAAQPRRHHRRVLRRRGHVALLLDHLVGRVRGARSGARGELRRVQGRHRHRHGGGLGVPGVQRAGAGGVRVRGARRGAGNPGHHPVHAHQAVPGAHVEGHRRRVPRHRRVLLPRGGRRVLGLRARRRRQRPRGAATPALARRRRQHDGRHPCRRKLSGICDADVRKHRDDYGHKVQAAARVAPPSSGPIGLRCIHTVRGGDLPVLRRPPRLLRRVWVHADLLLPPLRSVAEDQEAAEVQRVVVCQL
ncbi:hypothetical protein ACJX0J_011921, partial [Zea mays]